MQFDVLVVGGGIIGASVLRRLSEAGHRTMLIERQRPSMGATGYSGAMIRLAHTNYLNIAAASEGFAAYQKFPIESGGRVSLCESGHLYFGDTVTLAPILSEVKNHSIGAEILTQDEISMRWPGLNTTADAALYEPRAGYADPVPFVRHQINMAEKAGAKMAEATVLHRIIEVDGRIQGAHTSLGRIKAKTIVLATGPQTPQLLKQHGFVIDNIWSQKIQVSHFDIGTKSNNWPGFIDDSRKLNGIFDIERGKYHIGLPTFLQMEPSNIESKEGTTKHATATLKAAMALIPCVETAKFYGALCHTDCYSINSIGAIGSYHELPDGLLLATGFSGGGFKMAPYAARCIHEILA